MSIIAETRSSLEKPSTATRIDQFSINLKQNNVDNGHYWLCFMLIYSNVTFQLLAVVVQINVFGRMKIEPNSNSFHKSFLYYALF